jgi:dTDP-4-amino-4,6-dideoxygalactose transaminase
VYDYESYRDNPAVEAGSFPEAERAARQVASLPVHPWLSDDDLDHIGAVVLKVLG